MQIGYTFLVKNTDLKNQFTNSPANRLGNTFQVLVQRSCESFLLDNLIYLESAMKATLNKFSSLLNI